MLTEYELVEQNTSRVTT